MSEFSVFPIGGRMVSFAGESKVTDERKKYGWTGSSFLRIFEAACSYDKSLVSSEPCKTVYVDDAYHIGPLSTNKANNIYFITRTYSGKKGSLSKINKNIYLTQNMELYIQTKIYGQWQAPKPFAYNDVQKYSLGHAVLSLDEKVLYFVSDMPGEKEGRISGFQKYSQMVAGANVLMQGVSLIHLVMKCFRQSLPTAHCIILQTDCQAWEGLMFIAAKAVVFNGAGRSI